MPTSQSAEASARARRRAYGAPEAPVIPRKTRIMRQVTASMRAAALLRALGGLEEVGEVGQVRFPEPREGRHRRAGVLARGALQMVDLELDPFVLGALSCEFGRAQVVAAVSEICVAVEAARDGEQLRARDSLR